MNLPTSLLLRPALAGDLPLLYEVYASTRAEELAVTGWSQLQKQQFLRMQFEAQHTYYHQIYPDASYDLIYSEGRPAGRLYLHRGGAVVGIVDIALLPEFRGQGIGSILLREVLAEAAPLGKPVRIHVEHFNRALRLYERFGFRKIGDTGVYHHLEWSPPAASQPHLAR